MASIKYHSPIFDGSGYAEAGRNYIALLHQMGHEVSIKPISFEEQRPDLGEMGELMSSLVGRPITSHFNIIHLTPEHFPLFRMNGKVNIGHFVWETSRLPRPWVKHLDSVDVVFTSCEWNKEVIHKDLPQKPVYVIPHGIDLDFFAQAKPLVLPTEIPENCFIFYSISQWTERKNFKALLEAYWTEFSADENVMLLLKTYLNNHSSEQQEYIRQLLRNCKKSILRPEENSFARVILLPELMTRSQIAGLHALGDVYVLPTRAEGFGLPYAEAIAAGRPCIATNYSGHLDFLNEGNSWLVDSRETPVLGMPHIPWYTCDQYWGDPSIKDLRRCMREAYENRSLVKKKTEQAKKDRTKLSWEKIGKLYNKILKEIE